MVMGPHDPNENLQIAAMFLVFWIALCLTVVAYYFVVWTKGAI